LFYNDFVRFQSEKFAKPEHVANNSIERRDKRNAYIRQAARLSATQGKFLYVRVFLSLCQSYRFCHMTTLFFSFSESAEVGC